MKAGPPPTLHQTCQLHHPLSEKIYTPDIFSKKKIGILIWIKNICVLKEILGNTWYDNFDKVAQSKIYINLNIFNLQTWSLNLNRQILIFFSNVSIKLFKIPFILYFNTETLGWYKWPFNLRYKESNIWI